jgi:putative transposase
MQENNKTFKKGFKYRIYPNKEQEIYLAKIFGSCRFVYNRLLADAIKEYEDSKLDTSVKKKFKLSGFDMINKLQVFKHNPEIDWLKENPIHVIQVSAKNLGEAFSRFFKNKKGYPKFKSKHGKQSATFSTFSYTLKDKVLKLAKSDLPIKVKWSKDLPVGGPGQLTITKTPSGKYYVSFICEYTPVKTTGTGITGVDAGITDLAIFSDGTFIPNLRCYVQRQKDLRRLQKSHSRKCKGSKNKEKSRLKLAKLHEKIASVRNDYLHKLTSKLVRENQAVAIESLAVKNMSKNRKLSKHIMDAAWGKMRDQLKYKCIASQHCKLFLADPYYPSTQLCSVCCTKPKEKLKLGTRKWACTNCGSIHQRDHNAAKNLENLARSHLPHISVGINVILTEKYIPYL